MSSQTEPINFNRKVTIDDASFSKIVFVHPLEQAVQPIIDHNLELVEKARHLCPWYRGERDDFNCELLSTLLDPDANSACDMLKAFIGVVKRYRPHEFPAQCGKMIELEFTTRYLIRELGKCFDSAVFANADTHFGHLVMTLNAPSRLAYNDYEWHERLDIRLARLVKSFADVSDACRQRERQRDAEIAFSTIKPASAEDVREAAADVKRTVRKAKRDIIKDAHTEHKSEADRRLPKGERGKQIAAVRKLVREAREKGKRLSVLQACRKTWQNVKGGYPSMISLYDYCHTHAKEF